MTTIVTVIGIIINDPEAMSLIGIILFLLLILFNGIVLILDITDYKHK